eukprot:38592-Eustigmatos_ZCMA.PRE.1
MCIRDRLDIVSGVALGLFGLFAVGCGLDDLADQAPELRPGGGDEHARAEEERGERCGAAHGWVVCVGLGGRICKKCTQSGQAVRSSVSPGSRAVSEGW